MPTSAFLKTGARGKGLDPGRPGSPSRASTGNGGIDVYHMGVCAEDPPFLSQIDVFGRGENRKQIAKRALAVRQFLWKKWPAASRFHCLSSFVYKGNYPYPRKYLLFIRICCLTPQFVGLVVAERGCGNPSMTCTATFLGRHRDLP